LTDYKYQVLSLIRVFKDDEVRFAVGENYLDAIGKSQTVSEENVKEDGSTLVSTSSQELIMFLQTSLAQGLEKQKEAASKGQRNKKHGGLPTLKQCLSNRLSPVNVLGPDLIEHSILIAGLQPSVRLSEEFCADTPMLEKLAESLRSSPSEVMKRLVDLSVPAGFLVLEDLNKSSGGAETTDSVFYERFDPFILEQFKSSKHLSFANFNDAVDEFFSKIDIQRQEKADIAHKKSATKKINALKENQEQRIKDLQLEVVRKEHCAEAILANLENVDRAIQIVNSAIASGMSWDDLKELIAAEKSNGNEIAMMIDSLQLETGEMTVRLLKEQEEEDGRRIVLKAKVDLSKSAYKNVTDFFATKKSSQQKAERTIEHSKKVFDDAEKRFQKEIASHEAKRQAVRLQRKVNWFEKFRWFITSEGLLVLSGRDAQQNELLVKRYLRKSHGDIYVHADLHGAASCIVRCPRPGMVVPPESLRQAGAMTVCQSSAWKAKIVTSAWWVNAEQVSKTAPSGEYLSTGSFMIRGKKNYLPPCRLELSFGFIFKLDETQESFDDRKSDWQIGASLVSSVDSLRMSELSCEEAVHVDTEDIKNEQKSTKEVTVDSKTEDSEEGHASVNESAGVESGDESGAANLAPAKGTKTDGTGISSTAQNGSKGAKKPNSVGRTPDPQVKKPKAGHIPRGKKSKLKKIKKKYADQSEEDRKLAMKALGHHVESEEENGQGPGKDAWNEHSQGLGEDIQQERAPKASKPPKFAKPEKSEKQVDDELNLKSFTCNPKAEDTILYALPVCGPPQATLNYKHRIKIVPGSMKRGRASKTATEILVRANSTTEREKELIKYIIDNQLVQTMAGDVKLMAPGLSAATKAAKKSKQKQKNKSSKKKNKQ